LPGGLLERGEHPFDAVIREVGEEVGLVIEPHEVPGVVCEPSPRRIDVVYRASPAAGGDPRLLDAVAPRSVEVVEARWFPHGSLPDLAPEARTALAALVRRHHHLGVLLPPDVTAPSRASL
jgi:ADP-ribose pyrophosphatase YjhB (NUDIX family)